MRRGVILLIVLVTLVAAALVIRLVTRPSRPEIASRCTIAGTPFSFSTEQARNAATIAAVGLQRQLPERAMVIALATAMQESRLINVDYGDRDSLGLFQQRPSQGWGTAEQVQDPRYAANQFYAVLVTVPEWPTRPLTNVAQDVQRSAFPDAYSQWEEEATALASVFVGNLPGGLRCEFPVTPLAPDAEILPDDWTDSVVSAAQRDLPSVNLVSSSPGRLELVPADWVTASWLVAYAEELHITSISFDGRTWRPSGGWVPDDSSPTDRIMVNAATTRT